MRQGGLVFVSRPIVLKVLLRFQIGLMPGVCGGLITNRPRFHASNREGNR